MSTTTTTTDLPGDHARWYRQTLDPGLLQLDGEALIWFKAATGIQDEAELKEHLYAVQEKAFAIFPYPCIRNFNFTKLKISRLPCYQQLLELGKTRSDAILLDLGCCFGNDARKAIYDGYPAGNVICSDLRQEFWELGHELFRDKKTFSVPFVAGDVFDPSFLSAEPSPLSSEGHRPVLKELKTLTALKGAVSAIHASSFFHLFNKEQQRKLADLVAGLLSRDPGSMAFGSHSGAYVPTARETHGPGSSQRWADSPESWEEMWEGILGKGKCKVEARIVERQRDRLRDGDGPATSTILQWSVTIL